MDLGVERRKEWEVQVSPFALRWLTVTRVGLGRGRLVGR